MPKINLCFLWHMHQPFYKDLCSGEYRLPWTRMHALKDYYGMVKILEEFPEVRQTFNLVPSMMVQVEEYACGEAKDPFLEAALKPAENLTPDEHAFILRNFFMANPSRMIYRYPRYGELYTAYQAQKALPGVAGTMRGGDGRGIFGPQEYRDLQVLSQLAWFDEEYLDKDIEVQGLVNKGRNYSLEDQALMGRKQQEICAQVIPQYRKLAASGQIEISTTPFYHPILPLLCDSDIAAVSHHGVPLPPRFSWPADARLQLEMARDYVKQTFGVAPVGLWPSEGSVSNQALSIAASVGFEWAATDNGVLDRTLGRAATPDVTYRPYLWAQGGEQMRMIFRDHLMSDLIGFVYSGMGSRDAAQDFLRRIRDNCTGILASGRDALVPIILDGENAWEYYDRSGRPFFRELYGAIQADAGMEAVTVSEAFRRMEAQPLDHIFPGSWINANFDVWIGAEEDNKAWRLLLEARQAYAAAVDVPADRKKLAYEELLISEGSDWNWWYGPEHESANRVEFDQIYREHLANVYRALGITTPVELSQPILKIQTEEAHTLPLGPISPTINGVVDSYFEWLGAGVYKVDPRQGSMHGKRALLKGVHYGSDGKSVFLRVDFEEEGAALENLEVQVHTGEDSEKRCVIRIEDGTAVIRAGAAQAAFGEMLEIAVPLNGSGGSIGLSFWQDGLPLEAVPREGAFHVGELTGWNV
ncbi:MAG: glycoside hydrolase family 57 protein [Acidobacteriota bacterium]